MRSHLNALHPVLMVRDVPASLRFYARLGFATAFTDTGTNTDDPQYAGVRRDDVEMHLQWHDAREWDFPNDRPTYRLLVDDVDAFARELDAEGGAFDRTAVMDTSWGTRELHVRDPDGKGLQIYQPQKTT